MTQQLSRQMQDIEAADRVRSRIAEHGHSDQIDQLCLDSIQIRGFPILVCDQLAKCTNLAYLTLNYCEIESLANFPNIPSLVALEMISNHISGPDLMAICACSNLEMLALDQNSIQNVEDLQPFNMLQKLEHIEVRGNPLCLQEEYRQKIFNLLPALKIVDCQDNFGANDVMYGTETESERTQSEDEQNSNNSDDDYHQPDPTFRHF